MRVAFLLTAFCLVLSFSASSTARSYLNGHFHGKAKRYGGNGDVGSPLILTQYLSNPSLAQKLSAVKCTNYFPIIIDYYDREFVAGFPQPSFAGFFTVDPATDSNMYMWFFPAENNPLTAPVLTWLQGGPGASSMYGLFAENGPFSVAQDGTTLIPNPFRWTLNFSMIYIDNPVGVGFSYTNSSSGFVTTEVEVGRNMLSLLQQFFTVFPQFRPNDFYVVGESYGGKYAPSTAYAIYESNKGLPKAQRINLQGMAMGDGLIDPITQLVGYSELSYWAGICDFNEQEVIRTYEKRIENHLRKNEAVAAFKLFDELLNGDFFPYPTYFENITGSSNYFNLVNPVYPPDPYDNFLNLASTRQAIHVGAVPYVDYNSTVEENLIVDWMFSVKPWLETMLDAGLKVLVYNGQEDVILSGPQVERTLLSLKWKHSEQYKHAQKMIWRVEPKDFEVAGFVRNAQNLYQAIVRTAGHMVPADQPRSALDMMRRYVFDVPFGPFAPTMDSKSEF